jgi:hypothetical protein
VAQGNCYKCQQELTLTEPISRKEECPQCRSDVRVCANCQMYDPKVYNECRETQADRILEKERSNLCDFFKLRSGSASVQSEKERLRAQAEALFKNFKKS